MPPTLKLEIVTPEAVIYSEDVHMVTLPAIDGQIATAELLEAKVRGMRGDAA